MTNRRQFILQTTATVAATAMTMPFATPSLAGQDTSADASPVRIGLTEWMAGTTPVTLVYPTQAAEQPLQRGDFRIQVAVDAAPLPGRHPLIVISHGSGGSAVADHDLAAAFVRAGFVVAQPLHEGDNYRDRRLTGPESFKRRPLEVRELIDALAEHPDWSQRLDLRSVGVHGMSAGGVTALSLAGGQWSLQTMVRHCNRHREADEGFCFQGAPSGPARKEREARFNQARWVPGFMLPGHVKALHGGRSVQAQQDPRPDPRVAAISLAVPVAAIFTPESLARIRIPVFVVTAQDDTVLVPRFHAQHVVAHCRTAEMMAPLPNAGHFDILSPWPASVAREVAASQVRGGEPNPKFDPTDRSAAHARIVAFHVQHLAANANKVS
ncbi:dienelactone hydrolase [Hydrogenophaga sp. 5NK40-0174]|uniref:alpha/beta hydrolase family protein n=1 Tax=Hydrogenophaga sp. 5NK40-0174 TaxID=3127649 RepID=UPI00333FCAA5